MFFLWMFITAVIILVIGFFLGATFIWSHQNKINPNLDKEKENIYFRTMIYNEILLFILPIVILIIVIIYSIIINNVLLTFFGICILLPLFFIEDLLKRRKFMTASFDLITVKFLERSSYILFIFGFIFGILYAAQKFGLIK